MSGNNKYTKSLEKFCARMNGKAKELNMIDSVFYDPAGIDNVSTVKDILNCLVEAANTEIIYNIFSKKKDEIDIKGPNERKMVLESRTLLGTNSKDLCDYYNVLCGKGGVLIAPKIYNSAVLVELPDKTKLFCVIMKANDNNEGKENRFAAAKQALDVATKNTDNRDVCAKSAIVSTITENNKLNVLYEKNPCEVIKPASMSKMLTAIVVLEYIEDIYEEVCVKQEMLDLMPEIFYQNDFKEGDIVTVRDLMSAMFLPSSNSAAYILGCIVGEKMH